LFTFAPRMYNENVQECNKRNTITMMTFLVNTTHTQHNQKRVQGHAESIKIRKEQKWATGQKHERL